MGTPQSAIDSIQTPSATQVYYLWEGPGKPVCAQLKLDLIGRLAKAVVDCFKSATAQGSEIGGVLLGRVLEGKPRRTIVEALELLPCQYQRGPLYMLSDSEKAQLK